MEILEYFDGTTEKDVTKEYKLIRKIYRENEVILYFKSLEIDIEKEKLKAKVEELDGIVENLIITIMDLVP